MTVRINKDAINLREKLSQLDKPSGLVGEELLRADTSADAREALNLEEHLFEDFESTGIDDNATSTKVTVSDSGLTVDGNVVFNSDTVTISDNIPKLLFEDTDTSTLASITANSSHIVYDTVATSRDHVFKQGGTTRLTVDDTGVDVTGNVSLTGDITSSTTIDIAVDGFGQGVNLKRGNGAVNGLSVTSGGDVQFYEDTGTTAKFVWDASAESLGINTTNPSYPLTVYGSNPNNGIVACFGKANEVYDYTAIGLSGFIAGNNSTKAGIALKRVSTFGTGELHFLNNNTLDSSDMTLSDSKMMIDSAGNVGIGTASPSAKLDVVGDIKVSGGVFLGGTGTANKLDDYEEGEWTPAITGSTTVGSYSSVIAIGYYTKIGNLVTITGVFNGASGTGAGDLQLTNLPFSVVSDSVGVIQANLGLIYPTGTVDACLMGSGSTTLKVRCNKSDGSAYTHMAYPATASYVRFTLSYKTA